MTKLNINQEKIEWISFDCLPVAFTKFELIKLYTGINLNQKAIQFDSRILKNAYYRMGGNEEIYFVNQIVKMSKKYQAEVQYFKRDYLTNLKITNIPLTTNDIKNLLHSIINFGNIKILSLKLGDPSWVIDILDWWKQTHSVTSITLKVIKSFSLQQNHEIKLKTNEIKYQGIRVYIYGPSQTLKNL